ncbi:MAG: beta-Ala-His dipeptidase [Phycisphaerae bacterium]|nr:beta-Ala-His dipeptidase [Phycisphaerae bacterium]
MLTEHNQKAIAGLEPAPVWNIFAGLAGVPRPSKNEEAIQAHARQFAEKHRFAVKHEKVGNLVLSVPASPGCEGAPIVVLQGHLDMVAEKNAGTKHDFDRDPIRLVVDRDSAGRRIVRADGTTLGADNGMGVALALAAATEKDVIHGPLEILLTCDEEAGMTGAKALTPESIRGRVLINLDSEEDDALYIGCAGGCDVSLDWAAPVSAVEPGMKAGKITVTGLTGGHSGCDIHLNRGNAIKLLGRALQRVAAEHPLRLSDLQGGSKRNAIPREAFAQLAAAPAAWEALARAAAALQTEARRNEPNCVIEVAADGAAAGPALSAADTQRLLTCLVGLPSGVLAVVPEIAGLVQTSNNVSTIVSARHNGTLAIQLGCLSRSSAWPELQSTMHQIAAIGSLSGAKPSFGDAYPGWQPNPASSLLKKCVDVFKREHGQDPHVRSIHAGLECGIIGERVGGMDMISFGPNIQGAHSPDERVQIDSVAKTWKYLKAVLAVLAKH